MQSPSEIRSQGLYEVSENSCTAGQGDRGQVVNDFIHCIVENLDFILRAGQEVMETQVRHFAGRQLIHQQDKLTGRCRLGFVWILCDQGYSITVFLLHSQGSMLPLTVSPIAGPLGSLWITEASFAKGKKILYSLY